MGRHLLELRRRGYRATGVDRTTAYLAAAHAQAETEGLHIDLVREDVRELNFPPVFDGALNMYTSFGYFDDYNDDLPTVPSPAEYICPKHPHQTWAAGKCLLCEVVDSTADPNLTPGVAEQDLIDEEPITINNNPEEL